MKKILAVALVLIMAMSLVACNAKETASDTNGNNPVVQPDNTDNEEDNNNDNTDDNDDTDNEGDDANEDDIVDPTLQAPVLDEGPVVQGSDEAWSLLFTWAWIEGAEGYEVRQWSKYYKDEYDPDNYETFYVESDDSQIGFVCESQDAFDFRIQVRAYRTVDGEKVYSEWSNVREGSLNVPQ
ncbi:MAG: hypothetical protein IJT81_08120 [Lachnospiraceae bacterium]|nr:hypothetical protein [Lachnospiraceae bacterium]